MMDFGITAGLIRADATAVGYPHDMFAAMARVRDFRAPAALRKARHHTRLISLALVGPDWTC